MIYHILIMNEIINIDLMEYHGGIKNLNMVGTAGFEPATTYTPCRCATKLRYAPK